MAYSHTVSATPAQGVNNATTTGIDTTGADLIIISYACADAYATTPTDSKSNTYTEVTNSYTNNEPRVRMFFCQNPTVGTAHTFTAGGTGFVGTIFADAFSGSVSSPEDQINGNNSASATTTLVVGSITPTEDDCLIYSAFSINGTGTPISVDNAMTETNEIDFSSGVAYGGAVAYKIQTTAAAINPTWTRTNTNPRVGMVVSFKAAAATGPNISSAPATIANNATNVTLTGTNFGATQGVGKVEIWDDLTGTTKSVQTIDTWGDTSIQFDVVPGSITAGTRYLVVTDNGASESNKYSFTLSVSNTTLYKPAPISGEITSGGFETTILLISDES